MNIKKKYYVWRRDDGYIDASHGHMPGTIVGANGKTATFEKLGEFEEWIDALVCIQTNRYKAEETQNEQRQK